MLEQSLSDALHDAAMDLSLEQQRVDDAAEIVDDRIAFDTHRTRLRIDLDLDDMTTVRKGLRGGHPMVRGIEPRRHCRRQLAGLSRRLRHLEDVQTKIGARHAKCTIIETDIVHRHFENMSGDLLTFV